MWGTAARVHRKVDRRFKRRTKSQSSTGISQIFQLRLPPTLLTRMSSPPRRSTAASISFAAGASSVRSPATVTATPPAALMAAAVCSTPAPSMSPRAPSRARTIAISRPRPLAAPVTTATRFLTPGMRVMLAREPAPLPGGRRARRGLDCGGAGGQTERADERRAGYDSYRSGDEGGVRRRVRCAHPLHAADPRLLCGPRLRQSLPLGELHRGAVYPARKAAGARACGPDHHRRPVSPGSGRAGTGGAVQRRGEVLPGLLRDH